MKDGVKDSRDVLFRAIGEPENLTFIRLYGNVGDELIYAGTRQLLARRFYKEVSVRDLDGGLGALKTALVAGCGGWCGPYHDMVRHLPVIETRFELRDRHAFLIRRLRAPSVRSTLAATKALVFARERTSFDAISGLCEAKIAHDCAFFFDYRPYLRQGEGSLLSYRTDKESVLSVIPRGNHDISRSCSSLDEWLWTIARHAVVKTDRAHVMMIAAAEKFSTEKVVRLRDFLSYHKVPAIADYALEVVSRTTDRTGEKTIRIAS